MTNKEMVDIVLGFEDALVRTMFHNYVPCEPLQATHMLGYTFFNMKLCRIQDAKWLTKLDKLQLGDYSILKRLVYCYLLHQAVRKNRNENISQQTQ